MFSKYYTLALAALPAVHSNVVVSEFNLLFREEALSFVDAYFNDAATTTLLTDHGCWCSKLALSNPQYDDLGGLPLDDLDEICRDWFRVRNCNDRLNGGTCKDANILYINNFYKISVDDADSGNNFCLATDPDNGNAAYSQCEMDDCAIDLHYGQQIEQFLNDNSGFTANNVVDASATCVHHPENDAVRTCEGTAPMLSVVKTHRPATNFFSKTAISSTIFRVSDFEIHKKFGDASSGYQGAHTVDRPPSDGYEYYECYMKKMGLPLATVLMGWANTNNLFDQPGDTWAGHVDNELVVYHGWSGKLVHKRPGQGSGEFDLIDLSGGDSGQTEEKINRHDTAGVGWNRVTNEIIFVREGTLVAKFSVGPTADISFDSPHHEMISTVQLWFQPDTVVCTWDPNNWQYDVASELGW